MRRISEIVPDPELLLAMAPEEVGGLILENINSMSNDERRGYLNRYNFTLPGSPTYAGYPQALQSRISEVIMEGWTWLEREGLIAPRPGDTGAWVFITRRGAQMQSRVDVAAYRRAGSLPRQFLHPIIAGKAASLFTRGDYDTAVFQAFKEVEIAVRTLGGFALTDIGTKLMRKAFDADTGPLRDAEAPEPEREATAHLFAGAIGLFKNPQSHREAPITDSAEAVELLIIASHLLRRVDVRVSGS